MAKTDESWYQTTADVAQIKQALSGVLVRGEISQVRPDPGGEKPVYSILAEVPGGLFKKPSFGNGMAAAQAHVFDDGDVRRIGLVAFGTPVGGTLLMGAGENRDALRNSPVFKTSKNLVAALVAALQQQDPSLQRLN